MSKKQILNVGVYGSSREFLDALLTSVTVPTTTKVVDKNDGIMNEGQENQRSWASLTCVDRNSMTSSQALDKKTTVQLLKSS